MSIYAIGDLHLSFDERVDKPMDIFGPLWANHTERLKENWHKHSKGNRYRYNCGGYIVGTDQR